MTYPMTVIITGANGQIAVQLANALIDKKCTLLLLINRRSERIDRLVSRYPEQCFVANCNLASFQETDQSLQALIRQAGRVPLGLVHTAAVRSYDAMPLYDSDPEFWTNTICSNVSFAYNILRSSLPYMVQANSGKVVLMGSNVTRTGLTNGSAYAASKAAVANLVRSTALEMARHNIQINMVSPGPVATNLAEDYTGDYLIFRERYFAAYQTSHPTRKLVGIDDVVQVIMSLLRTDITMQSGEEIFLTGGVI